MAVGNIIVESLTSFSGSCLFYSAVFFSFSARVNDEGVYTPRVKVKGGGVASPRATGSYVMWLDMETPRRYGGTGVRTRGLLQRGGGGIRLSRSEAFICFLDARDD